MPESDGNKITRLEVQMDNIEKKVDSMALDIRALTNKLDNVSDLKFEIQELKRQHSDHVIQTEREIKEIKARNLRKGWLYPTLSAVAGSVLTFLIIQFLENVKK